MDQLAAANINVVYVDMWRFGYPYYRSEVFHNLTGKWTDPGLVEGRDILQEMIAEGHRAGLEVDAWFEAGFAAAQLDNRDLYFARPAWFARKQNGSVDFFSNGGLRYNWLSHCNQDAQQFLIDLAQEVAAKYDVDGIEFDRVRYPELDCGYDSATVELYKSEHDGQSPPTSIANTDWIRWRADKLTQFVERLADSIKAVNPALSVTNAPLWYGYEQFCQDWPPWANEDYLDLVSTQMYFSNNTQYTYRLDVEIQKMSDKTDLYPGISTVANGEITPKGELISMIETTRSRGLQGNVIWYHFNLLNYLDTLSNSVYAEPAELPYRETGWRQPAIIINETDSSVQKSDGWVTYDGIPGFENGCLYATGSDSQWIEYHASIPANGWYEIYVYIIQFFNATKSATYQIDDIRGEHFVTVDQTVPANARWHKIGDYYLSRSENSKIVTLTNKTNDNQLVFSDALMLLNTNRLQDEPSAVFDAHGADPKLPPPPVLEQNYPNPFNPVTRIDYRLSNASFVNLTIYNLLGEKVVNLVSDFKQAGSHSVEWDAGNFVSGVYFYRLMSGNGQIQTKKLMLLR